jgi:hypothetical protein
MTVSVGASRRSFQELPDQVGLGPQAAVRLRAVDLCEVIGEAEVSQDGAGERGELGRADEE